MVILLTWAESEPHFLPSAEGFQQFSWGHQKAVNFLFKNVCMDIAYTEVVLAYRIFNRLGFGLRARAKIPSNFRRRCILPGGIVKVRKMLDIPALSCQPGASTPKTCELIAA